MSLTYGGMFEGYGGLTAGAQSVLGGESRWFAEFEAAPSRVLAHHWPDVPNLGDVTKVDWAEVEPVDVITGGSPCQDLSHAGKRAGMTTGTRSNLWVEMREAIATIRPKLVIWENVRGAYSAEADSALEFCPGCMGDPRDRGPSLRALGRVLGDLSDLRYDARWYGLRAADVGACHGRFRVFVFATPADSGGLGGIEAVQHDGRGSQAHDGVPDQSDRDVVRARSERAGRLTLLPTPAVNDMGAGKAPDAWDAWTDRMKSEHGNGNGHGKSLEIEAMRLLPTPVADNSRGLPQSGTDFQSLPNVAVSLLPTPRATDGTKGGPNQRGAAALLPTPTTEPTTGNGHARNLGREAQDWAQYEAAIRRHEHVMGRLAPLPTEPGPKGGARLSPKFVEWMMWLPEGHVTDPAIWEGLTDAKGRVLQGDRLASAARNAQLKMLGNGVVTAQVAAAARRFVADVRAERAA